MKRFLFPFFVIILLIFQLFALSGCSRKANVLQALDSKDLTTSVKMSDSIFLEPVAPEKQTIWLRIRNSSDREGLDSETIKKAIANKLEDKGYRVKRDPTQAHYRLDANILYVDRTSDSLTADLATLGGFGGALAGSDASSDVRLGRGLLWAATGAVVGSMIKVNKYAMVIDVQVSERVAQGVKTQVSGKGKSGGGSGGVTKSQTFNRQENYLHHQTRVASTAKQTNLEFEEALPILTQKISNSLSGIF